MGPKIYLSHPIRGLYRTDDPDSEASTMQYNNELACRAGELFRAFCPEVIFYVPAEHEEFVLQAYRSGMLSETQILDVDCAIISTCDAVVFFDHQGGLSNGMKKEFECAERLGLPSFFITSLGHLKTSGLVEWINSL